MGRIYDTVSLSELIVQFGMRPSLAEARSSIRNGVVKVNGEVVVNPDEQYKTSEVMELQCVHKIIEFNWKG